MKLTGKTRQGAERRLDDLEKELWRVNWKQHGYPYCGLYAVAPDNFWPTKVGISQNPVKRLMSIQSGCWRKVDIHEYRYCANINEARAVEKKTHEMLSEGGLAMQGEWFDVRPEKAIETAEFAANVLGVELRSDIPAPEIREHLQEFFYQQHRAAHIAFEEELDQIYGPA